MRSERSCKWLILLLSPLPWNIHIKGQYPDCDSIKDFIKTILSLLLIIFDNLARTKSFLPAFRFLSICKPSNFCLLLFQILSSPIWAQTFSCLQPDTNRWHLSWFNFILFWNHSIVSKLSCSSLFIKVRFSSQAKNVVSAKLQTSVDSIR